MSKVKYIGIFVVFLLIVCVSIFINGQISYQQMAIISIIQLFLCVFIIKRFSGYSIISFPNILIYTSWVFHCGQIILKGLDINGDIPLDFTIYASHINQTLAYKFYILSQFFIVLGVLLSSTNDIINSKMTRRLNPEKSAVWLILIGIIPRIYVDVMKLIGGIKLGYKGVYSLYIPQFVNTLAFFCDVGFIILLINSFTKKKASFVFWIMLIYKSIAMMTGSRQEKVVFLIIWLYIYYFRINKFKFHDCIKLIVLLFVGVLFINAIGDTRSENVFSLNRLLSHFSPKEVSNIIGDFMGEFGSSFSSLEIPFEQIPAKRTFAYGKSYLAGVLSIFPLLVSKIPGLSVETTYIVGFSNTAFLGGSFLGEAYYNFSWSGLLICFFVGIISSKCHIYMHYNNKGGELLIRDVMSIVISISILLFVRGYFTDMIQKIAWVYFALIVINKGEKSFYEKREPTFSEYNRSSL